MSAIAEWLVANGLGAYVARFAAENVDIATLPALTDADLRELGLTIGHRKMFQAAVAPLRATRPVVPVAAIEPADDRPGTAPERRHLTVMFCDVIGSSAMSERLDPEDYRDLIGRYRDVCSQSISKFDGFVAQFVGDGVLAYFGHPIAHENNAERAVRAGLDITRAVDKLIHPTRTHIQVRVGIATGPVIVGDLFTSGIVDKHSIVGVMPNFAARVQAVAPANSVVIADSTHRLINGFFGCENLGAMTFPGFSTATTVWRVKGERHLVSRFRAAHGSMPATRIVNRIAELWALNDDFSRSRQGTGRARLIIGEAGIGKSRLVAHFLGQVAGDEVIIRQYLTSPFNQNSPLHPLLMQISKIARVGHSQDSASKLKRIEAVLLGSEAERQQSLAVIAAVLSIPTEERTRQEFAPRQLRESMFQTILRQLRAMADVAPVVIVVEDLHWLDPTSLLLIERVLDAIADCRVFLLMTCRETFDAGWLRRDDVAKLTLSRLSPEDSLSIIRNIAGPSAIDAGLEQQIVQKTDGMPLFIEEFTNWLLETPTAQAGAGHLTSQASSRIPDSLQESLMARLSRAGAARELAQVCSVIGRSGNLDLLAHVAQVDVRELADALAALARSDIVFTETADGQASYAFKHALLQDAAYQSLLRDRRRELHARTAIALAELAPELPGEQPELLAHHLTEAGMADEAVSYWLQAGKRAMQRSAIHEAPNHLHRGLQVLESLPESQLNLERRLQFLVLLGPALIALKGPGSTEVEDLYAAALDICKRVPEAPSHFAIYWGWWRLSRDYRVKKQRSEALLSRARARVDAELLLQAHHCVWASRLGRGDLCECCDHIDRGLAIYASGDYRAHASMYGNHDAKVCGHGNRALVLWMQGEPEQALAEERKATAWAHELTHDGSAIHAMDIALMHRFYRRDVGAVLTHADVMIRFAEDKGFADHRSKGLIFRGWADAMTADRGRGLATLREGFAQQKDTGTIEDFPMYYCMLADALSLSGLHDGALEELTHARRTFEEVDLWIWLPEVWRQSGELMLRAANADPDLAQAAFAEAARIARRQGALALDLRAATSLARLLVERDNREAARAVLEPCLSGTPPAQRTRELAEAADLLAAIVSGATLADRLGLADASPTRMRRDRP